MLLSVAVMWFAPGGYYFTRHPKKAGNIRANRGQGPIVAHFHVRANRFAVFQTTRAIRSRSAQRGTVPAVESRVHRSWPSAKREVGARNRCPSRIVGMALKIRPNLQ